MENVELVSITPNAMELLKQVAAVCYQAPPSEKVVKKIVKLGHLNVLEHCYATFRFKMSVACLLQRLDNDLYLYKDPRTKTWKAGHKLPAGEEETTGVKTKTRRDRK